MVVLGIDIGGTKTSFGILKNQQLLNVHTVPTAKDSLEQFEQSLLIGARYYLKNPEHAPQAIGVAAPGYLNSHKGVVHYASNLSILRNYPLKERLQSALNIPVFINNDANTVVMGGSVSLSQTEFINAIRQHFQTFMSNFRIIPLHTAALGSHTGVIGAGLYAQRHTQP